ncbi:prepilin peptidase [Vibrio lentus]|nr:prepilin peptidase [Vibrio lentus]
MDVKYYKIGNKILTVLFYLQFVNMFLSSSLFLMPVLIVMVVGMMLYWFSVIAAGDIKYAAVLSLSIPMELLPSALLLTMLAGGVLASFYLLFNLARRIKANANGGIDDNQYNTGIPYGVAISVGFYVMIFSHWVNYI